jgi:apolipoprotein N-acyltransferase
VHLPPTFGAFPNIHGRHTRISRRAAYLSAVGSGAVLALAYPEPDLAPLAWVSLAPFLLALRRAGGKRGAGLGLAFGVAFFGVLIHWISIVGYLAFALLVLVESAFVALFGTIWGRVQLAERGVTMSILGPALVWVAVVEYLRSVFPVRGFAWGQLAQSQHNIPHLLRVAGVGGGWLLAFLLVVVNALLAAGLMHLARRSWGRGVLLAGFGAGLLLVPFLIPAADADGDPLRVAIVQGNVPRTEPASFEKDLTILRSHARLTEGLREEVDLVVWPESSVGIDPFRNPFVGRIVGDAARAVEAPMVVGGDEDLPDNRYRVMAFLVGSNGRFEDRYQKTHLVPFGEYVPGRRFLDWIPALDQVPRDAVAAREAVLFDVARGRVAPVISFEGDFGSLVRGRIAKGGRLLVVATNTSTWGSSWASAQHVAMSKVRAAENGVYVAHGAISGISAFIDPQGRVLERIGLWEAGTMTQEVFFADEVTLYARTGDWVAYLSLAGVVIMGALSLRRRSFKFE